MYSVFIIFISLFVCIYGFEIEAFQDYETVVGEKAVLSCNVSLWSAEKISLVLWYKGNSEVPIYTLDVRDAPLSKSKHISAVPIKGRSFFNVAALPPVLIVENITKNDEGQYKCRVDYKKARTQNSFANLTVIVPPKGAIIMDAEGQRLEGVIGPFEEGSDLLLICEAEGGDPSPTVKWWRRGDILDESSTEGVQGFTRNELHLSSLGRDELMVVLTCLASNTDLVPPSEISVSLDLLLKPIEVHITSAAAMFSAGRRTEMHCESFGSRPPALISWWKGSKKMTNVKDSHSVDGNVTYSVLSFIPAIEDNGKYIVCRAENQQLSKSALEEGRVLNVQYRPQLSLSLGASLQRDTIREGTDVYFECNIMANPWVNEVSWLFESKTLFSDTSAGIIVANQSLVLQKVKRRHRGKYQCVATNREGTGKSEEVMLKINFAPICKSGQRFVYAVARNEKVHVHCEVESDPADVDFRWIFNNSQESNEIRSFISNGTQSIATYVPRTRFDFGSLQCIARNAIGAMLDICVFNIIPAGPPESVANCFVSNQTTHTLLVECTARDSGALKQYYFVEVYDTVQQLIANVSNFDTPIFYIKKLFPSTSYELKVYSANSKGRSVAYSLKADTLPTPERHTGQDNNKAVIISPLIGVLTCVVGALVMVAIIIALVMRRKMNDFGSDNDVHARNDVNSKNNEADDGSNGFDMISADMSGLKQTYDESEIIKETMNAIDCQAMSREMTKYGFKQNNLICAAKTLNAYVPSLNNATSPRLSYDNVSLPSVMANASSKRVAISHPLQPINCAQIDLYQRLHSDKQINRNCDDRDKLESSCCLDGFDDFSKLNISHEMPIVKELHVSICSDSPNIHT